jgi:hypothetical protein
MLKVSLNLPQLQVSLQWPEFKTKHALKVAAIIGLISFVASLGVSLGTLVVSKIDTIF